MKCVLLALLLTLSTQATAELPTPDTNDRQIRLLEASIFLYSGVQYFDLIIKFKNHTGTVIAESSVEMLKSESTPMQMHYLGKTKMMIATSACNSSLFQNDCSSVAVSINNTTHNKNVANCVFDTEKDSQGLLVLSGSYHCDGEFLVMTENDNT